MKGATTKGGLDFYCNGTGSVNQARRVGSVEGGSFIFWEVFFSTGDTNTSAEGASI